MNKGVFLIVFCLFLLEPAMANADACYCKSGDCFDDCSDQCVKFCESFGSMMQDCIQGEECYEEETSIAPEFSTIAVILLVFFISGGYVVYKKKHVHRHYHNYYD